MLFIALCALIGAGAVVVLAYLNYFIILIVVAAVGSVVLLLHGLDVLMQKIL
jgi:hypothetical protein